MFKNLDMRLSLSSSIVSFSASFLWKRNLDLIKNRNLIKISCPDWLSEANTGIGFVFYRFLAPSSCFYLLLAAMLTGFGSEWKDTRKKTNYVVNSDAVMLPVVKLLIFLTLLIAELSIGPVLDPRYDILDIYRIDKRNHLREKRENKEIVWRKLFVEFPLKKRDFPFLALKID